MVYTLHDLQFTNYLHETLVQVTFCYMEYAHAGAC